MGDSRLLLRHSHVYNGFCAGTPGSNDQEHRGKSVGRPQVAEDGGLLPSAAAPTGQRRPPAAPRAAPPKTRAMTRSAAQPQNRKQQLFAGVQSFTAEANAAEAVLTRPDPQARIGRPHSLLLLHHQLMQRCSILRAQLCLGTRERPPCSSLLQWIQALQHSQNQCLQRSPSRLTLCGTSEGSQYPICEGAAVVSSKRSYDLN